MQIDLRSLAKVLGGEVSGEQVLCPGPGHRPKDRSLSVKLANNPDGFVVHSHADDPWGRCKDHVKARIGATPFEAKAPEPPKANGSSKVVARYDYTDELGELLFQAVRLEPKGFKQRRPDGNGGWLNNLEGVRRVPYRLPELLEAIATEKPIFIAEGEKAVDALVQLGVTATCSPMGAGKWRDSYNEHFMGADVIILPDNDGVGRAHAEKVTTSLAGTAARVRTLALPKLPDGGDPFDWISAGGSAKMLWKLLEEPAEEAKPEGFNIVCLDDIESEPVVWIWEGYLARGKLTLLGGDPDLGKSLITVDAAARLSTEAHWPIGPRAPKGSTIFICSEDGLKDTVRPRCEAAGADLTKIFAYESTGLKDGKRKTFSLQDDLETLGTAIDRVGNCRFVVIDAITSYLGTKIDSHNTTDIRAVLEPIAHFAEKHGVAICGVTHPPKAAQGNALRSFAGSFAFVAAPRVALFVTKEPETDRRLLLPVKNNIGQKPPGRGYFIGTKIVSKGIIAPHVLWDDAPVDVTADQAVAANHAASKEGGALEEANELLTELLVNGPIPATEGEKAAKAHGISEITLKRARKNLGIEAGKGGFEEGWLWYPKGQKPPKGVK